MAEFLALLAKVAGRPSLMWRLAWLVFCLVVLMLFGARTLELITPSVMAGATGSPSVRTRPVEVAHDFGPLATWILPTVAWLFIAWITYLVLRQ